MLSKKQKIIKRIFDLILATIGIITLTFPILILVFFVSISTKKNGFFNQERIGQNGKIFRIYKIRSMLITDSKDTITIKNDIRITKIGKFIRKYNLDELPQIYNVFMGDMSFVGPRPDVKGYADLLEDENQIILTIKPGITGPATLKFKNEELILASQPDPKKYNDEVLWQEKIKINKEYISNWSFFGDIRYILKTLF